MTSSCGTATQAGHHGSGSCVIGQPSSIKTQLSCLVVESGYEPPPGCGLLVMKGRQPSNANSGGSIAAGGNVVICTGIVIAIPIYALATGMRGADLLIAGAAFAMGIAMLVGFVRTLMMRRATTREDGAAKKPENESDQL
jgi:hypothetical protein